MADRTEHTEAMQTNNVYDSILNEDRFFWSTYGESYMVRGNYAFTSYAASRPVIHTRADWGTDKFRIVPVTQVNGENINISEEGVSVAISVNGHASDTTVYISCGGSWKNWQISDSCHAHYTNQITKKETFLMTHCEDDNTYTFKSYNGYYLHYNEKFLTVAFKRCRRRKQNQMPVKGRWSLRQSNEEQGQLGRGKMITGGLLQVATLGIWGGSGIVGFLTEG